MKTELILPPAPDDSFERAVMERGHRLIAGVDEVGRGPLAGPVVAAAVILDLENFPEGLNDSKKLTPKRRAALSESILNQAQCGIGVASVAEIDQINILQATYLAMRRAVEALPVPPEFLLVDGNRLPVEFQLNAEAVVKGDARSISIAAASIIAKEYRDNLMSGLAEEYPGYGWERNAGYGSKAHMDALKTLGVTPHHRRSFKPIHNILYQE